ncbi:hypothetical protein E3N88_16667 [Mikania micrantha]|uniref:Uncharacterized protein n=1 Tax=Mikania micrantha TaxID=192012 RepID=A0A5N6P0A2_9ASTR|nr:hypothetical protein E3N88_16667 [Mikania micrantha]
MEEVDETESTWHASCMVTVELTHYGNYAIIARISYYDCLTRELHVLELWEDVKYQVKPLVIYTSTKSEDSLSVALQQNDGAREVPAVKLMKSSIFSYEQAWHSSITRDLVSHILEFSMHLLKGINFAAELDCFLSLALVARQNNYVRPTLTAEAVLDIRNGRYVLQEMTVGTFISIDTMIMDQGNMDCYQCFLVALIVFLAHIGSIAPVDAVKNGIGLLGGTIDHIMSMHAPPKLNRNQKAFDLPLSQQRRLAGEDSNGDVVRRSIGNWLVGYGGIEVEL